MAGGDQVIIRYDEFALLAEFCFYPAPEGVEELRANFYFVASAVGGRDFNFELDHFQVSVMPLVLQVILRVSGSFGR